MIQNNTFRTGNITEYNACVGKNGINDIQSYEDGYHDTVNILLNGLIDNYYNYHVDTLVYPILFSARHRIELFLKKFVAYLELLNEMKGQSFNQKDRLNTHDLQLLWNYVEHLIVIDKRLIVDVNELANYIKDYFEIDLTGETFRYPFNNVDDHHLDELSHINLLIFKSQYEKMSKIISHLDILLDFLINEYKQGTFAGGLSRNEIEKICNELPHRDTWKNVDFKSIKNSIMSEYALSSRKFSEVIRKIKEHKEFAYKIGILIENKEISKDIYTEIKRTRSDIVSLKDTNYNKLMSQFQLRLKLVLNDNNCAALRAFYEIGFHQMYSEEYENLVQYYLNQDDNISTLVSQILPRKFIPFVEKGMKICCQWHLLEN